MKQNHKNQCSYRKFYRNAKKILILFIWISLLVILYMWKESFAYTYLILSVLLLIFWNPIMNIKTIITMGFSMAQEMKDFYADEKNKTNSVKDAMNKQYTKINQVLFGGKK